MRWLKWALVAVGLLVAAAAAAAVAIVSSHYTDCFADFPSKPHAARVLAQAHSLGLDDSDLVERSRSASIRISSGETGDDAKEFRHTVRFLVAHGGGHMEKTPCLERPAFN